MKERIKAWNYEENTSYRFAYLLSRIFDTPILGAANFFAFALKVELRTPWFLILLIGDFLIPMVHLIYSHHTKRVSDLDITDRKEREAWYTVLAISWTLTLVLISLVNLDLPDQMRTFQIWLAIFGILNATITFLWKISAHAMLSTSLVLWLSFLWSPWYLILLITFVPLICWGRLRTRKHSLFQLLGGILLILILNPIIWTIFK